LKDYACGSGGSAVGCLLLILANDFMPVAPADKRAGGSCMGVTSPVLGGYKKFIGFVVLKRNCS